MIEKMKFLSITGPKADIDRVVNTYLSKYEIHLENALSELTAVESLSPFMEINPYKEALSTANSFYDELADPEKISAKPMDTEQALNTIRRIQSDYQELSNKRADLESQLAALDESLRVIRPFRNINYNISSILKFQFIHFRFGRIEKEYYQKFEKYIYENLVQQLRKERDKRQVIIATHNSTIVTNSISDVVFVMKSDGTHGWVDCAGYVGDKEIKRILVDYLEGGVRSFIHKNHMYQPVLK